MKRNEFDLCKKEIRRLLREIDSSFVSNHVYSSDSALYNKACKLRNVTFILSEGLLQS